MKLSVRSELIYDFQPGTEVIASVQAALSRDQTVLSESLTVTPAGKILQDPPDERGERRIRAVFEGETRILYEAEVDNGFRLALPPGLAQHAWSELPRDAMQYLTASIYCPSDKFVRFAHRQFGGYAGSDCVLAVLDWIVRHVDYVPGISNVETTAERTFVDRAGVCRDFTHLGITLCRALNIPARAVSAYAYNLSPPDFHAVFEVFVGGGWWLVDPTGLVDVSGLVRIGVGRDAADIAFLTTSQACERISQSVSVEVIPDTALAATEDIAA